MSANTRPVSTSFDDLPEGGQVVEMRREMRRVLLSEPRSGWAAAAVDQLNKFCALPFGWDGHLGKPVAFENAWFLLRVLERVSGPRTPAPSIVPLSGGGVQVEWHRLGLDVECTVYAPNNVACWVLDESTEEDGVEFRLSSDFSRLMPWIQKLEVNAH